MRTDKFILAISGLIFAMLVMLSIVISNTTIGANLVMLGVAVLTVPYSFYKFLEFKKVKAYEKEFPNFLRDLAESQRAGLTLAQAVQTSSKAEYGLLTNEVNKINTQLSWNVSIEKVFKKFAERMAGSKIIVRSLMIIDQANKSGGNIEDTMDALADNIESLRDVQAEKSVALNQQVVMMYAIFFIFLGISVALIKFLVPLIQTQELTTTIGFQTLSNPCSVCIGNEGPECFGCHTLFIVTQAFDFGKIEETGSYYKSLFLVMIVIQGIFSGLIAGQISSDSVVAGTKHSMLLLFSGFTMYMAIIKLGIV